MYLSKGTIYPRMPNTDDGIRLNKGVVYISAWGFYVAPPILWEVLDITLTDAQLGVTFSETEYGISFTLSEYGVSMEVALLPTIDNTVRFTAVFSNLAGAATDLDAVPTLTVYNCARATLSTSAMTRSALGTYYADYEVEETAYAWEVEGLLGGEPVVGRTSVAPTWFTE